MESWSTRSRRRKPPESIYTPLDMSSSYHQFVLDHSAAHVALEKEGQPPEHAVLRDAGVALERLPHTFRDSFIVGHCLLPLNFIQLIWCMRIIAQQ